MPIVSNIVLYARSCRSGLPDISWSCPGPFNGYCVDLSNDMPVIDSLTLLTSLELRDTEDWRS